MTNVAVVPASGTGSRMGSSIPKQFLEILGKPILIWVLEAFEKCESVDKIVLILSKDQMNSFEKDILKNYSINKLSPIVVGADERFKSVYNGLKTLSSDVQWVLIHDGVRPLIQSKIISGAMQFAQRKGSAVCATPIHDTVKEINENQSVVQTLDRTNLYRVQTPQIFKRDEIIHAYELGIERDWIVTDDAAMMEKAGFEVFLYQGDEKNIKVTTPDDIILAEKYLEQMEVHS